MILVKAEIKQKLNAGAREFWINGPAMRQSKGMLAIPEKERFTKLRDLERELLRVATIFLTGHGSFKVTLKLFN